MKVIIYGSKGTLGSELERQLRARGDEVFGYDREEADVTDLERTKKQVAEIKPDVIFNAVGYNNMDKAETEPDLAYKLNATGAANIAEACLKNDAILVHYSSGYIFEGTEEKGYNEEDQPNPQSVYAKSKYEGEKKALEINPKTYMVRLNLLFGAPGPSADSKKTFPDVIQEAAQGKESLDLVTDEISTPTYANDLVKACLTLIDEKYPFGIYHLANEGRASWYDFAKEIFRIKGVDIKLNGVSSDSFERPAKRPKYSVINNNKFPKIRTWQQALEEYLSK